MLERVMWTGWDHQGSEHLTLQIGCDGIEVESHVTGGHDAHPYALTYRLQLDADWRVRRLSAQLDDGRECHLSTDGQGQWWCPRRGHLSSLTGCLDIDIAATPFTNTLPIRRLDLATGASATVSVALLSVPALDVSLVRQRYTRLSSHGFRYEGIDSGVTARLEVDDHGLVLDYPETFRRKDPIDSSF